MPNGQPQSAQLTGYLDGLARLGGAVSAVELVVADLEDVRFRHAAGFRVGGEPLRPGARFDAASLTKPWMATLALVLDGSQTLPLATALAELFPGAGEWCRHRTVEDLLRHRSGIAAWGPLAARLGKRLSDAAALSGFLLSEGLWPQTGEAGCELATYSDLGYVLWGLAAEKATGRSLADLLDLHVTAPLGLAPLGALAGNPPPEEIVECRLDNWKEVELAGQQGVKLSRQAPFLRGVPQDGNARAMGRLAGHAGLFVNADEMLALGREWLRPARLLNPEAIAHALEGDGPYALGWARQSADGSSGPALAPGSFGHTGFTGGSLWIEPERERCVLVLAHRLSSRLDMNPIRREIHRLTAEI
jgi:CubicO group peptidase (beta-lactamase class C family)